VNVKVIRPENHHRRKWELLYAAYAEFYKVEQTPAMRDLVWSWFFDAQHETECLLAVDDRGEPVGLAHFRAFARPLAASTGGFLDDLFVEPAARGSGAARALIEGVANVGRERGWSVIRWITADDNYRARTLYDKLAKRTSWLTYDLVL